MPLIGSLRLAFAGIVVVAASGTVHAQCERAKLTAPDGRSGDRLGISVALDGQVAVAGAFWHDTNEPDAGAAYVYRFDGSTWQFEQEIIAPDGGRDDWFGRSVDISGDTIVVGAFQHRIAGIRKGAAYVFRFDGASWSLEQKLVASDPVGTSPQFGNAVAIDGDTILVGSRGDEIAGDNTGAAYIFRRSGSIWTETVKLTAPTPTFNDHFGQSVSVDGDAAMVGALEEGTNGPGRVHVYRFDGTRWNGEAVLRASDGIPSDSFGRKVSLDGDVAAVSAAGARDLFYVFRLVEGEWREEARLFRAGLAEEVSIHNDVLVAGTPSDNEMGDSAGAAYVFRFDGTQWIEEVKLTASDAAAFAEFGMTVAVHEERVLVGAVGDDQVADHAGAAYVIELGDPCDPCEGFVVGDSNCNGEVNALDIEPFTVALFTASQYAQRYPSCDLLCNNDMNGDGFVDSLDIEPFLDLLFGP